MLIGRANSFCSPVEVGEVFVAVSPDNHWVYQSAGPMGTWKIIGCVFLQYFQATVAEQPCHRAHGSFREYFDSLATVALSFILWCKSLTLFILLFDNFSFSVSLFHNKPYFWQPFAQKSKKPCLMRN